MSSVLTNGRVLRGGGHSFITAALQLRAHADAAVEKSASFAHALLATVADCMEVGGDVALCCGWACWFVLAVFRQN